LLYLVTDGRNHLRARRNRLGVELFKKEPEEREPLFTGLRLLLKSMFQPCFFEAHLLLVFPEPGALSVGKAKFDLKSFRLGLARKFRRKLSWSYGCW